MTLCSEIVRRAMVEFKSLASAENAQAAEALDGMAYLNPDRRDGVDGRYAA